MQINGRDQKQNERYRKIRRTPGFERRVCGV